MKTGSILACLFLFFLLGEMSFIHAFSGILAHTPLMMIAGMIVMQRIGREEGSAWFVALALIQGDISALIVAGVGPILITRLFTTRSVYALLGFGSSTALLAMGIPLVVGGICDAWLGTSFLPSYAYITTLYTMLTLVPGLFVGMSIIRFLERSLFTRISLRPLHDVS